MAYVILYLSCMALGYFCGSRVRSKNLSAVGISGAANVVMPVSYTHLVTDWHAVSLLRTEWLLKWQSLKQPHQGKRN